VEGSSMKRLLRSIIDFDGRTSQDSLSVNFRRLRESPLNWIRPADQRIFGFVSEYFQEHLELPTEQSVKDYFVRADDIEVQERLSDIEAAPVYTRSDFARLHKELLEDQNRVGMLSLLKETQEVVSKGMEVGKGRKKKRIRGVKDAVLYFSQKAVDYIIPEHNTRVRGDARVDSNEVWKAYQEVKATAGKAYGCFTGLEKIDTVCKGCKRGELWLHAAFAGELKTTFAMNWCYNQVTHYKRNIFYASFEMTYEQLRRQVAVLHSANLRWGGRTPLDYCKVRDGELSPEDEAFLQEVLYDWENNPEYCRFQIWCPDHDVNMDEVRMEVEIAHKSMDVGLLVLDHGGLMEPRTYERDYTIRLNSVIRDAKKLALHFNAGEGIPLCLLFQINREGKDYADKNEGKYKMRALSYANEAERSADYVTTSYLNDQRREEGNTVVCNLKNRENPLFPPHEVAVDFSCRRLHNMDISDLAGDDINIEDIESTLSEV